MNRNNSPGLGQWLTVTIMAASAFFLFYKLYMFAGSRSYFPAGLTVAGIDVGGMTAEEASELLSNRYIEAPIAIFHGSESFEISPTDAEFTLDLPAMLSEADYQRSQQDFWAGFWGYLWGRAVEVEPVPLAATHRREALRDTLERISVIVDQPAQPPQPVPGTLSFQYGTAGTRTNFETSFADIEAALYRPSSRVAHLVVEPLAPVRPDINLLARLLTNHLQDFEQTSGAVVSVFILDLQTGEEISINADIAMSGMDILKIPIVLNTYEALDNAPTLNQRQLISDTLVIRPDHASANQLLGVIAGQDDPYLGAQMVTEFLRGLGLINTFIIAPYDGVPRPNQRTPETPANTAAPLRTNPTPQIQTTAEDMGTLLSMLYYCAQRQSGALIARYPDQITPAECQQALETMKQNQIGSLIEEGVPAGTAVAHRHGWISDTHGDAGIIFSPGGDYVLVQFIYKRDWLEWEVSSPLLAQISRATYNFFNFDNPYLQDSRAN
jgi:beta-lactamase class A